MNNNYLKNAILFWSQMALLLSSCNRYFYSPNDFQMLPMQGKGSGAAGVQVQSAGESFGAGINGAYCPTNFMAVKTQLSFNQGSGQYYDNRGFFPSSEIKIKGRILTGDLAAGLYSTKIRSVWAAVFAGGGMNNVTYWYNGGKRSDLNYVRVFLQPEVIRTGRYADIGMGLRTSQIDYYGGKIDASIPRADLDLISEIDAKSKFRLNELNFMVGARLRNLYFRNSFTWLVGNQSLLPAAPFLANTSLIYRFDPKLKAKRSKHL